MHTNLKHNTGTSRKLHFEQSPVEPFRGLLRDMIMKASKRRSRSCPREFGGWKEPDSSASGSNTSPLKRDQSSELCRKWQFLAQRIGVEDGWRKNLFPCFRGGDQAMAGAFWSDIEWSMGPLLEYVEEGIVGHQKEAIAVDTQGSPGQYALVSQNKKKISPLVGHWLICWRAAARMAAAVLQQSWWPLLPEAVRVSLFEFRRLDTIRAAVAEALPQLGDACGVFFPQHPEEGSLANLLYPSLEWDMFRVLPGNWRDLEYFVCWAALVWNAEDAAATEEEQHRAIHEKPVHPFTRQPLSLEWERERETSLTESLHRVPTIQAWRASSEIRKALRRDALPALAHPSYCRVAGLATSASPRRLIDEGVWSAWIDAVRDLHALQQICTKPLKEWQAQEREGLPANLPPNQEILGVLWLRRHGVCSSLCEACVWAPQEEDAQGPPFAGTQEEIRLSPASADVLDQLLPNTVEKRPFAQQVAADCLDEIVNTATHEPSGRKRQRINPPSTQPQAVSEGARSKTPPPRLPSGISARPGPKTSSRSTQLG